MDLFTANDDFLYDYVAAAVPITGNAYTIDTVLMHTFLLNFLAGNDTTKAKMQGLGCPNDGCEAFKRLMAHYEGVSIHAIDILCEADEVLKTLFYAGEQPASHHICGGLSLRRDLPVPSMLMSREKDVSCTPTK